MSKENGILLLKEKEILSHATIWMNLKDIMLHKISQLHTHTHTPQTLPDSPYMRSLKSLKNKKNKIKNKLFELLQTESGTVAARD